MYYSYYSKGVFYYRPGDWDPFDFEFLLIFEAYLLLSLVKRLLPLHPYSLFNSPYVF